MYRSQLIDTDWPQSISRLQERSPRIPSFDFYFFIAVIDHIANTTKCKTAKFFFAINIV
jgi:hypothetical protein